MEHYAGEGMMTRTIRGTCGPAAKLDIEYDRGMDVLTSGGFAYMPENHQFQLVCAIHAIYFRNVSNVLHSVLKFRFEIDKDTSCINTSWVQRGLCQLAGDPVFNMGINLKTDNLT